MNDDKKLTIYFIDGTEMKINYATQHHDTSTLAAAVEKAAERNKLLIEIEGALYVFPYSNIKYVRVSPSPEKMPDNVIKSGYLSAT